MKRTTKKLNEAYSLLRVMSGSYSDNTPFMKRIRQMRPAQVYGYCVAYGYYWNVARQDWQSVSLTLTHVQSAYALSGNNAKGTKTADDFLNRLVKGGILRKTKSGYKRTQRIDLSKEFGDFDYGR